MRFLAGSCTALAILVLASCGGTDDGPPRGAVTGKVTFDGQTVTAGTLAFTSEDGTHTSSGEINEDGTYEIAKGAPLGTCMVEYAPPSTQNAGEDNTEAAKAFGACVVPEDFRATVEPGDNTVDIELIKGQNEPEEEV